MRPPERRGGAATGRPPTCRVYEWPRGRFIRGNPEFGPASRHRLAGPDMLMMLDIGGQFGWPMPVCMRREALPPSPDPSDLDAAVLARFRGFAYARPFDTRRSA